MNVKLTAVSYARVSTNGQAMNGVSLAAQKAKAQGWAAANGYELVGFHVDAGLSGKAANRPGLQAALAQACQAKAALVVYSLSRLARSTKDAIGISERLAKAGADLVSLSEKIDTTSAAGKMVFRMLAVLAEFERDCIAERTRFGMAHLRAQGRRISRILPFGYDLAGNGRTLVPNRGEQRTLMLIRKWRKGGKSLREIAATLRKRGVKTKTGGTAWAPGVVRGIVRRVA